MKHLLPVLIFLAACDKSPNPVYNPPPPGDRFTKIPTDYPLTRAIPEASGIAGSRTIKDQLWVLEDSGNPPRLFLLQYEGFVTDSFMLQGATNRDWEDMAVGKGPADGATYLYIGDIGDNNAAYPSYTIYRVPEPTNFGTGNITEYDRILFKYPDASHDAEALLVDDATKDIYIITKRDAAAKIYKLPYPQSTVDTMQAQFVANMSYTGVVSAALSPAGTELIVKTYTDLYYYSRAAGEGLDVTLAKAPSDTLAYQLEPQGEAVTFATDNSGFFTLSEKGISETDVPLFFYRRTQ